MRVFLDEGEVLITLLRSLISIIPEKALRFYGQTILRILASPTEEASTPLTEWPLVPLSTQEQRVLRLLVTGRTNPEIASELVISINTVKDHVKHIYRKLNISNRREAWEAVHRLKLT